MNASNASNTANSNTPRSAPSPFTQAREAMQQRFFARRVPVVLQHSDVECGAACLAMILSYHKRKTSVAECRDLLDVGRDGVTAQAIARQARKFGLRVRAFSVELDSFKNLTLPAIVHWKFEHFVVVEKWSETGVDIVDPAIGRRHISPQEFDECFTGVALTFDPTADFQTRHYAQDHAWGKYFLAVLLQRRSTLWQILGVSLISMLIGLSAPLFNQLLLDQVLPTHSQDMLFIVGAGMALVVAMQLLARFFRSLLLLYLESHLGAQLMLDFFEHLLSLPYAFFQRHSKGDLIMRLGANEQIRSVLSNQSLALLLDGLLIVVLLAVLIFSQPLMAALTLLFGALQTVVILVGTRVQARLAKESLTLETETQGYLVEAMEGILTLKASGTEHRALAAWTNLFYKSLNAATHRGYVAIILDVVSGLVGTLAPLVLLWVGIQQVMAETLSLGALFSLLSLSSMFLSPLATLVYNIQALQLVRARLDRLIDVLETEPEQTSEDLLEPELRGSIQIKNLSFRYSTDSPEILHDISLDIPAGSKVALVGLSGSGKSTLANVLLGLYQPTAGKICYDHVDLRHLQHQSLRNQIGVVLQESFLFSGSVRQNIAFNTPDAPLERLVEAAKQACIHDDIMATPMKYEMRIAEGGRALSGGQRQRLSLARALAGQPRILILDEASSQLDTVTEQRLEANLAQLNCTRIVIAHRLSTVRNADLIVVLDQGSIVEQGSHEALMARKGAYAWLVQHQYAGT